mgnify:CR=1 FL=1|jgi:hypothetical protein
MNNKFTALKNILRTSQRFSCQKSEMRQISKFSIRNFSQIPKPIPLKAKSQFASSDVQLPQIPGEELIIKIPPN